MDPVYICGQYVTRIRQQDPQLVAYTFDRQLTTNITVQGIREQIYHRPKARPVKQWESAFERCQSS